MCMQGWETGMGRKYAVKQVPALDYTTALDTALDTGIDAAAFEGEARGHLMLILSKSQLREQE